MGDPEQVAIVALQAELEAERALADQLCEALRSCHVDIDKTDLGLISAALNAYRERRNA